MLTLNNIDRLTTVPFEMEIGVDYNQTMAAGAEYFLTLQTAPESAITESGVITVIKLNSDSLVADFEFETENHSFTEGKLKSA